MLLQEIIAAKRDGRKLSRDQIEQLISATTSGAATDAQLGAFAMAVVLRGMETEEVVDLTLAMRDSGSVLDWDLPGPVVDKHSTGGIGDNVSLILAPALAACGVFVPMISGRGLGHTGGTLDKLDAIPGYNTQPDLALLRRVTGTVGCAIIGQTDDIAPADRRLYAIRDVSATVPSPELICASILSKKLAAGLDALVLDVKFGSGAFLPEPDKAADLAQLLTSVAKGAGCPTTALLSDMNEPLASAAGNALEVANAVRLLRGDDADNRLWDLTVALGSEVLHNCGAARTLVEGWDKMTEALGSGAAAEKFAKMVSLLGGPADFLDKFETHLPMSPVIEEIFAPSNGFVGAVDTRGIGLAVIELGGGRQTETQSIDYAVGLDHLAGCGALVDPETPIARVHAANRDDAARAGALVRNAYSVVPDPPEERPLIAERRIR